jgi:hypothetical protein
MSLTISDHPALACMAGLRHHQSAARRAVRRTATARIEQHAGDQPVPGLDPAGSGQGLTSPWPQGRCPSCGTALDGGPVLFRCATCAKAVPAADLDMERGAGGPAAGDGVLACHKNPSPDPRV